MSRANGNNTTYTNHKGKFDASKTRSAVGSHSSSIGLSHSGHIYEDNIVAADHARGVTIRVAWLLVERWTVIVPIAIEQGFNSIRLESESTYDGYLETATVVRTRWQG
jgi:hypothetical protein